MPSPGDRALIKAEIERLQKAQEKCHDSAVRKKIDDWIVAEKQKLSAGEYSCCPICGKPCPKEEGVTLTQFNERLVHKACYRESRISTQY